VIKLNKSQLIQALMDVLDVASIEFQGNVNKGLSFVEANLDGQRITVVAARAYGDYHHHGPYKYEVKGARHAGNDDWLTSRYVQQTKRGSEGDAERCLEVMRGAAAIQKGVAELANRRAAHRDARKDLMDNFDSSVGSCSFRLNEHGIRMDIATDDWTLLSDIQLFLKEREKRMGESA